MINELKTWIFQCDKCHYSHTVKTITQSETITSWLLEKRTYSNGSCRITKHYHICSGCVRKNTGGEIQAFVDSLPKD